jgi:tRNA(Ile)-lysidine synthetase-like protein
MALFSLLIKGNYDFDLCFVNYHLIPSANSDEEKLRGLCRGFSKNIHVLSVYFDREKDGNEEDWARIIRYDYFLKIAKENNIQNILVAHNEDDLLETYLLQKQRNNVVSYYGLNEKYVKNGINILRPLLNYKKEELLQYDIANNIPYSIDPSNADKSYKRNKLRAEVVSVMDDENREKLLQEIKIKNNELKEKELLFTKYYDKKHNEIAISPANPPSFLDLQYILIRFLEINNFYSPISSQSARDYLEKVKAGKNFTIKKEKFLLFYSYGRFYITSKEHFENRGYLIQGKHQKNEDIIKINKESPLFKNIDYEGELIIKPVDKNDYILVKDKKVKMNRQFISWKVPEIYRNVWPGIYDESGKLLYVPRFQKEIKNTKKESLLWFDLCEIK